MWMYGNGRAGRCCIVLDWHMSSSLITANIKANIPIPASLHYFAMTTTRGPTKNYTYSYKNIQVKAETCEYVAIVVWWVTTGDTCMRHRHRRHSAKFSASLFYIVGKLRCPSLHPITTLIFTSNIRSTPACPTHSYSRGPVTYAVTHRVATVVWWQ